MQKTTKQNEKPVWMACRATAGCEGKYVTVAFKRQLRGVDSSNAGQVVRYKCTTCERSFHINH